MRASLILIFSFVFLLGATSGGCVKPPQFFGKIWVGNSQTASIDRGQEPESMKCSDPLFDNYFCMSERSYACFVDTFVLGCKEWRKDAGNTENCKLIDFTQSIE